MLFVFVIGRLCISIAMKLESPSASRNKFPILEVLKPRFEEIRTDYGTIRCVEIAPGTGEHAAFLCSNINKLIIQGIEPDDSVPASIAAWAEDIPVSTGSEVLPVITKDIREFDVNQLYDGFTTGTIDVMLCVNMIHISDYEATESLFAHAKNLLREEGRLFTYGPYRVDGQMTESNIAFDASLKSRNMNWGVRDIERVEETARMNNIVLMKTNEMPANNLLLEWARKT
jgi:SAM-dependent methyltransferase